MTALRPHPRPEIEVDYDDLARVVFRGCAEIGRVAIGGAAVRDRDRPDLVRDLIRRARRLCDALLALIDEPPLAEADAFLPHEPAVAPDHELHIVGGRG